MGRVRHMAGPNWDNNSLKNRTVPGKGYQLGGRAALNSLYTEKERLYLVRGTRQTLCAAAYGRGNTRSDFARVAWPRASRVKHRVAPFAVTCPYSKFETLRKPRDFCTTTVPLRT